MKMILNVLVISSYRLFLHEFYILIFINNIQSIKYIFILTYSDSMYLPYNGLKYIFLLSILFYF